MATVEQGINLHNTELQQSSSGAVSTLNFLPSVPSSWTPAHADSYTGAAAMWEAANAAAAHPVAAGDHQGQANCINLMGKMAYTSEHTLMGAGLISTSIMEAPGSSAVHNWTAAKYTHEENQLADQIDKKDDDPAVLQYSHYAMLGCGAGRAADQDTAVVPSAAAVATAEDHHPDAAALLLTSSNPAAASTSSSSSSLLQQKRHRDVPGSLSTTSHVAAAQPPDSPLHKKQRALSNKETLSKEDEGSLEVGPALNTNGRPRAKRGSATDPQSVYARQRRERINERLKILQNLVPNGAKVDIVTMLEEAISYVKFLQLQVKLLSSDEYWMYAPTTYNGIDVSFDMLQHSNQ